MTNNFRISPAELKALIESAYSIAKQKKEVSFSVQEIAQTVREYGIEAEDLVQAHKNLQTQKRQKQQRTSQILLAVALTFCLTISVLYQFIPKKFRGNLDITLTTQISPSGFPLDKTKTFQIFQQQSIYAVLNFYQMNLPYDIVWEIRDSQNKLVRNGNQKIHRNQLFQTVLVSCPLSFANEIGAYKLNVFADGILVKEQTFEVEYGQLLTSLISDNQTDMIKYSKSAHQKIIHQIKQAAMIHSGALEWRWIAPDGSIQKHTIRKVQKNTTWQFKDSLDISAKKTGIYRVELIFRNTKIDDKSFEIMD